MKQIFYFIILFFAINNSSGQINIDLKEIEKLTKDSSSVYFYATLTAAFNNDPIHFAESKAKYLYFGRLFTDNYKMLQNTKEDQKFNSVLYQRNYIKAIHIGKNILEENPTNLETLTNLNLCYNKLN